jgi:hypothetical protein
LLPDANANPSGDGMSNFSKYQLDLDPTKPANLDPAAPVKLHVYTPARH